MIKDTKPNLFDKIYIKLTHEPVWAGTYDRSDFVWGKEVPPRPVYHALCPVHGYFKNVPRPKLVESGYIYGFYCKECGHFHALKWRGREHLVTTKSSNKHLL
jgi:hypothetical protein